MKRFCILFILCPLIFASCPCSSSYTLYDCGAILGEPTLNDEYNYREGDTCILSFAGNFEFKNSRIYVLKASVEDKSLQNICFIDDGSGYVVSDSEVFFILRESDCDKDEKIDDHVYRLIRTVPVFFRSAGRNCINTVIYTSDTGASSYDFFEVVISSLN
jgi:hypothetical protein